MQEIDIVTALVHAAIIYSAFKLGQWTIIVRITKDIQEKLNLGVLTEKQVEEVLDPNSATAKEQSETLLEVERVGTNYYAYSNKGQFLAQGSDFRGLMEAIKKQYPGRSFRLDKYQPNLTEEETDKLVKSIFDVYGDKK